MKSYFLDKMKNILFLEIKEGSDLSGYNFKSNIYLPIKAQEVVNKAKEGDNLESIPIHMFIEGMIYVMGLDEDFKFNEEYKRVISHIPNSTKLIKGIIFKSIKDEKYEEAYVMLKGLMEIEFTQEVLDKALLLLDEIRKKNSIFIEEERRVIKLAKDLNNYPTPYYYEAILQNEGKQFNEALFSINQYIALGGDLTKEVSEFKSALGTIEQYDKGKEIVYDDPKKSLEILIPLIDIIGDSAELYYYIALAYRILENYEKGIYYLNEALAIDSNYVEVFNEMGINYACLEDYEKAIQYFRKVFEVTKSIEVCTNLIMCYMNIGDMTNAKNHLDIAEKLDPNDEIVIEIKSILKV